jgi:hypothetical protein
MVNVILEVFVVCVGLLMCLCDFLCSLSSRLDKDEDDQRMRLFLKLIVWFGKERQ